MWQKPFTGFLAAQLRRPRMLAQQLTNLSRERSEAETLKKHLPICQEHGKSCCLFYAGKGPTAQHPSIWLTNHRNFKTELRPNRVSLGTQSSSQEEEDRRALGKISYWALGTVCAPSSYNMDLLASTVQGAKRNHDTKTQCVAISSQVLGGNLGEEFS